MSSKLCPYVLMSESFDRRTKEQKQLIRIFSKVCLYVLLSIFLTVCYFLEGKHGGMCSPKKRRTSFDSAIKIMSFCSSVKKTLMSSNGKTHQTSIFTQETNHGKSCRKP